MTEPARLLLTRPLAAAQRFVAALEAARGGPVPAILSPILDIHPVAVALQPRPAGLILTSENAAARLGELGLEGLPAWCVGPRTAAVAQTQGASIREVGSNADSLVAALRAARPQGPLLHLRGEHARGDLAARLRAEGIDVGEAIAYRQGALPPTAEARAALRGAEPLVVPLFSPRSAMLLARWRPRAPLSVVALSEAVADAAAPLRPAGLVVARAPEGAAMVEATIQAIAPP